MILFINFCVLILLHSFIAVAVILIGLYFVIVGTIGELDSAPQDGGFNYHDTEAWKDKFSTCNGHKQSPIDMSSRYFKSNAGGPPLNFHGYDNIPVTMKLINTGHSLQLKATWLTDEVPYFGGGPLEDNNYVFEQLHFHWGPADNVGSEHTVNLQSFPMEMHIVHYNQKYGSMKNATNYDDGISVIAVFFDIGLDGSKGIDHIVKEVNSIIKVKSRVGIKPFALTDFEGLTSTSKYASYQGSLTTPPCNEVVTWFFPVIILDVTKAQMESIRLIQLDYSDNHNYRPLQPINGRNISIFKHN